MRYRDTRLPSGTELRIEHDDQVSRVELVNISSTGARLKQLGNLPEGALVTLCHLHLRFPARVMWSDEAQTGVRFARALSTSDMTALRVATGRGGAWGSSAHHGFRELS